MLWSERSDPSISGDGWCIKAPIRNVSPIRTNTTYLRYKAGIMHGRMKVAGYVRVSTMKQKEEGSHERQRERLQSWADREGHDIDIYEDIAISGQDDDRPEYRRMMDSLDRYDAVAVRELSRLGRSLQQLIRDIEELGDRDVDFISLSESLDTTSAHGRLMFHIIGAFDQFWSDLARERAVEEAERRRENGEPLGRPKKVPYEDRVEMYELHQKGVSYSALAKLSEKDLHRSTVRRYVEEIAQEREDGDA